VFSLIMLGSGSAGNSALVATEHCKILVDGGLSARQVVLRLEQCGVTPEQLDGVVLTHEHTITSAVLKFSATNSICRFTAIAHGRSASVQRSLGAMSELAIVCDWR
jgi:metal-dependent hydrolase (beta-lactamase superfamily II)